MINQTYPSVIEDYMSSRREEDHTNLHCIYGHPKMADAKRKKPLTIYDVLCDHATGICTTNSDNFTINICNTISALLQGAEFNRYARHLVHCISMELITFRGYPSHTTLTIKWLMSHIFRVPMNECNRVTAPVVTRPHIACLIILRYHVTQWHALSSSCDI
jgi:hypothetical protein